MLTPITNDFGTELLLLTEQTAGVLSNSYKNSTELHSVETVTNFHTYLLANADSKILLLAFRPKTISFSHPKLVEIRLT